MADSTSSQPPENKSEARVQPDQQLRLRRLGMSCLSYLVSAAIGGLFLSQGLIELQAMINFMIMALVINLGLFLAIRTNWNLRFREPSLTFPQMVLALFPVLYLIYSLDSGQARAIMLVIATVPPLYGTLALDTKRFLLLAVIWVVAYGATIGMLYWQHPELMNNTLEIIQFLALMLSMGEISIIGGYISGLRSKLNRRNQKLTATTEELNAALEEIQDLAIRDVLTGLVNRRHLFDVLTQEINRCTRATNTFSLCILDIDFFKQVNDKYGHSAGDEVLTTLASTVSENLRNMDCFGRYGGEEFLLILPLAPLDAAMTKAERVRCQIEAIRFPSIADNFGVTVSIGIAEYQCGESPDDAISRADAALYQAKAQGRNRIVASTLTREDGGPDTPVPAQSPVNVNG